MTEPLFDPSLKKKKKKKTVAFNEDPLGADADPTYALPPAVTSPEPQEEVQTVHEQVKMNGISLDEKEKEKQKEEDDILAGLGDFKKKKKKKEIPLDLGESTESIPTPPPATDIAPAPAHTAAAEPEAEFDLSDLKKKKKSSKKKAALDLEAFEKELSTAPEVDADEQPEGDEGDNFANDEDLGDDPFAYEASSGHGAGAGGIEEGKEPWAGSDRDYKYPELLSRFFTMLHAANPALASNMGKRYTIAPPQILREGNKKSIFANIPDICRRMHRQPEHVIAFMLAEMGTTGSVDGSGRLVIKGRFLQKQVENVLRRYIVEYVTCKTCKSPDTILTKENRIYFLACESCGSRRSVSAIKSGFQAQVGKRSKNKVG